MKTLLMVALSMAAVHNSYAQGSGSHGGDGLVIEFTGTARLVRNELALGNLQGCPTEAQFKDAIDQTKVVSEPTVFIDFVEHDAKNDSDAKLITLSRTRLTTLSDPLAYVNLVMHEYFGILKLEGTNDTSVSQGCLRKIRSRYKGGLDLDLLVYKINAISTFERMFAAGKAVLQCGWKDRVYRVGLSSHSSHPGLFALETTLLTPDGFFTNIRSNPKQWLGMGEWLAAFKIEYSIADGLTKFRFTSKNDKCTSYSFESLDHIEWRVTLGNSPTCSFVDPLAGRGEAYSMSCQPVYIY